MLNSQSPIVQDVPVLGIFDGLVNNLTITAGEELVTTGGKVVVYGDSNCLDGAHMMKNCYWLLDSLLNYVNSNKLDLKFELNINRIKKLLDPVVAEELPARPEGIEK